jgi:hypothetical protein
MKHSSKLFSRYYAWLSAAGFVVCLFQPAYYLGSELKPEYGYTLLAYGPFGLPSGYYAWLANPAYLIGLVMYKTGRFRASLVSSLLGLAVALSFLTHQQMWDMVGGNPLKKTVVSHGAGYWLWLAAFALLAAGAAVRVMRKRASAKTVVNIARDV